MQAALVDAAATAEAAIVAAAEQTAQALQAAEEKAEEAQEAIDLAFANAEDATAGLLNAAQVQANVQQAKTDQAIKETKDSITTIVTPAIDGVKKQISELQTKITKDIDEGLKKQLTAVQNGLVGVSAAFAATTCQSIKDKQPSAQDGPYWVTSKVDKKAIIVWCAVVGSKFYSLGGDGSTKGQAASSCFSQPLITDNPKGNWIDPNVNAEDPSNAVQINCGDGRGKTTAGLTCKSIKLKWGVTSNKHYWVIGRK